MKRSPAPRRGVRTDGGPLHPAPAIGLVTLGLLLLVPVVFARSTSDAFEIPKLTLLATGAAALLYLGLVREFARIEAQGPRRWAGSVGPRFAAALRRDPLGGALILFLLSAAVSTVVSPRPAESLLGAPSSHAGLRTALATAAIYFACRSAASDRRWFNRAARAASIAALVASGYALLQLAGLDPFHWTRRAVFGDYWRVPGTLGHANFLGAYLAMTLPLTFWLSRRAKSPAARAAWALAALPSLLVLATTLSRGAWVALAGAAAAHATIAAVGARRARAEGRPKPPLRRRLATLARGLAVAMGVFLLPLFTPLRPMLLQRIRQITDVRAPSTQSRVYLWRIGLQMVVDHPAFGTGTDGYGAAFPRYRPAEYWRLVWNETSTKAHSELIHVAATQGLPGLLAACLVVLLAGRAILRAARVSRAEAAAAGASLAAFGVSGLVGFTVVSTGALAAATAGWAASAGRRAEAEDLIGQEMPRPSRVSCAAALIPAAGLWTLLVLIPLQADLALAKALAIPQGSTERIQALDRAFDLAPWAALAGTELSRTLLAAAFSESDTSRAWAALGRARAASERTLRVAPQSAEDHALYARILAAQAGRRPSDISRDRVRRAFDRALGLDSTSATVLELAVQGYLQAGFPGEARAAALHAIRLYPDFARPMADLGTVALSDRRYSDAADTLALAADRDWHGESLAEAATRANLARAYLALGRHEGAKREAARALDLDPGLDAARKTREAADRWTAPPSPSPKP